MRGSRLALALGCTAFAGGYAIGRLLCAYDFRHQNVVIAGGSRGLGLVIARQLAREEARVILLARDPAELQAAVKQLHDHGAVARTYVCDVSNRPQVESTFHAIGRDFRRVDVLINNAGVIQSGAFSNQNEADFRLAMETHFFGPLYTIWSALPLMTGTRPRIANISSIGGRIASPHLLPYCASKFALRGFSLGLAAELRKRGIRVTTVCPSLMRTGSHLAALFKGRHEQEFGWFAAADSIPLLSIRAERAAAMILRAIRMGRAELTFPWHWRAVAIGAEALPGITTTLSGIIHRLLPSPSDAPEADLAIPGYEARGDTPPRWVTGLSDKAAAENNQPQT